MTNPPPNNAALHRSVQLHAQAMALWQQRRLQEAVNAFQQAIQAFPGNSAPYQGLIELLTSLNENASAARVFGAIPPALYQQAAGLRLLHARFLLGQRDYERARALFEPLLATPGQDRGTIAYFLASCHGGLGQYEQALEHFRIAHAAGVDHPALYVVWGLLYQKMHRLQEAEALYREGMRKYPDFAELPYELAVLLLRTGRLAEGFPLFRQRWQAQVTTLQRWPLQAPEWDGRSRVDSLLVVREQGLGDQLVYSSLLPALQGRVGRVTVAFDARLHPLLRRSWPGIDTLDVTDAGLPEASRRFDAYLYAGDIGAVALEGVGWKLGALQPDAARAAALRARYAALFPGKKLIGISWTSPKARMDARKTVALAEWQPILATQGCQFINLQYGNVTTEIEALRARIGIDVYCDPDIDASGDIDGLAAQIAALDQVITISNTTAHVAAAQGKPTWTLLPCDDGLFWYWGWETPSTPWYPAMRLFRARQAGRWDDVIADVAQALGDGT